MIMNSGHWGQQGVIGCMKQEWIYKTCLSFSDMAMLVFLQKIMTNKLQPT